MCKDDDYKKKRYIHEERERERAGGGGGGDFESDYPAQRSTDRYAFLQVTTAGMSVDVEEKW